MATLSDLATALRGVADVLDDLAVTQHPPGSAEALLAQFDGLVAKPPSAWDVSLMDVGAKKINVIKEVRAWTMVGLKEAKDLTEGIGSEGALIRTFDVQDEALECAEAFSKQGARMLVQERHG